jgi:hypothetical protein
MTTPETVDLGKDYYVRKRLDDYGSWHFAFWRELFQNSIDAGATVLAASADHATGKGSFGEAPDTDRVVRVRFRDNGKGMDETILRNVFFALGQTTKRNSEGGVGGFGMARMMLCFSQVRYAIRTRDIHVEGNGSRFIIEKTADAIARKRSLLEKKRAALLATDGADEVLARDVKGLDEEITALDREPVIKGTEFEIDLTPQDERYSPSNPQALRNHMAEFLSASDIDADVTYNGEAMDVRLPKGRKAKRWLAADDNGEVAFAKAYAIQRKLEDGTKDPLLGHVIVRSRGVTMFKKKVSETLAFIVVVELEPKVEREGRPTLTSLDFLNGNRDSLKYRYDSALDAFMRELAVDTESALRDKEEIEHKRIKGGKGLKAVTLDFSLLPSTGVIVQAASPINSKPTFSNLEDFRKEGYGGVPSDVMIEFLKQIDKGAKTFLDDMPGLSEEAKTRFKENLRTFGYEKALKSMDEDMSVAVVGGLRSILLERERQLVAAIEDRFKEMNDVHIMEVGLKKDKSEKPAEEGKDPLEPIRNAARRYNPNFWRQDGHLKGRGKESNALFAAWTAAVDAAYAGLAKGYPGIFAKTGPARRYVTGFYFAKPENRYNALHQAYENYVPRAVMTTQDKVDMFLLNPVFNNGHVAYDLDKLRRSNPADRDEPMGLVELWSMALHEVAHVMRDYHDETYAAVLTNLVGVVDQAESLKLMKEAIDITRMAYGDTRSRVQPMEGGAPGEDGEPRPWQALAAVAAPMVLAVAGASRAKARNAGKRKKKDDEAEAGVFDLAAFVPPQDTDAAEPEEAEEAEDGTEFDLMAFDPSTLGDEPEAPTPAEAVLETVFAAEDDGTLVVDGGRLKELEAASREEIRKAAAGRTARVKTALEIDAFDSPEGATEDEVSYGVPSEEADGVSYGDSSDEAEIEDTYEEEPVNPAP